MREKITVGFWCSDWKRGQNRTRLSRRWKCLTAPLPKHQVLDDEIVLCSDIWKTEGQDLLPVLISQECGVASNTLRILFRLVLIQRDSQIETNSPRFLEIHSMDGSVCVCPSLHLYMHVSMCRKPWDWPLPSSDYRGSDPQGSSHLHLHSTALTDWNSSPGHRRTYCQYGRVSQPWLLRSFTQLTRSKWLCFVNSL